MSMWKIDTSVSIVTSTQLGSEIISLIELLLRLLLILIHLVNLIDCVHLAVHARTAQSSGSLWPDSIGQISRLVPILTLHVLVCNVLEPIHFGSTLCYIQ